MVFLAFISVALLCFEVALEHTPAQMQVLVVADFVIAGIFFVEWWIRFFTAPDRHTFVRRNWWELLAAIPINHYTTQFLRGLNILRVVRLIRLLRLIRFLVRFKILLDALARFAERTYLIYLCTLGAIIWVSGALGFHYMEAGHNPNVKSLFDSFWWSAVTLTTIGYGDIFPITVGGRVIAMGMMGLGVATISTITAFLAAAILRYHQPTERE